MRQREHGLSTCAGRRAFRWGGRPACSTSSRACHRSTKTGAAERRRACRCTCSAAIVTANLLYVAGILVRADAVSDIATAAPWLLGTVGTVFLDLTIFYQVVLITLPLEPSCLPLTPGSCLVQNRKLLFLILAS